MLKNRDEALNDVFVHLRLTGLCGVKAWGVILKVPNFKSGMTLCGPELLKDLLSGRPQRVWGWFRYRSGGRNSWVCAVSPALLLCRPGRALHLPSLRLGCWFDLLALETTTRAG